MVSEEKLPFSLCLETGSIWNMPSNKQTKNPKGLKRGAKDGKGVQQKNPDQAINLLM